MSAHSRPMPFAICLFVLGLGFLFACAAPAPPAALPTSAPSAPTAAILASPTTAGPAATQAPAITQSPTDDPKSTVQIRTDDDCSMDAGQNVECQFPESGVRLYVPDQGKNIKITSLPNYAPNELPVVLFKPNRLPFVPVRSASNLDFQGSTGPISTFTPSLVITVTFTLDDAIVGLCIAETKDSDGCRGEDYKGSEDYKKKESQCSASRVALFNCTFRFTLFYGPEQYDPKDKNNPDQKGWGFIPIVAVIANSNREFILVGEISDLETADKAIGGGRFFDQ